MYLTSPPLVRWDRLAPAQHPHAKARHSCLVKRQQTSLRFTLSKLLPPIGVAVPRGETLVLNDSMEVTRVEEPLETKGMVSQDCRLSVPELAVSVTQMWKRNSMMYGDSIAIVDPHNKPGFQLTYRQLEAEMHNWAAGLQSVGLAKGDKVALFAENSIRWIVADQGTMMAGGMDVVRGSVATPDELAYIMQHSGSTGLVVQDAAALRRVLQGATQEALSQLKFVVVLWTESVLEERASPMLSIASVDEDSGGQMLDCPVVTYEGVIARGRQAQKLRGSFVPLVPEPDDLATLVYTSGTTGHPKGVMLTHRNLLYQTQNLSQFLKVDPGSSTLSLLPPWHIYERTCSYYIYSCAARQVCTNIRKFRDDLTKYPPDYFVCVPLVLESLHHKVMTQINSAPPARKAVATFLITCSMAYIRARRILEGTAMQYAREACPPAELLRARALALLLKPLHWLASLLVFKKVRAAIGIRKLVVSGGGSLASHLDDFFEALGVGVLNGWGLTETSPVLACRTSHLNVRGTVGEAIRGTELRVVDPVTREPVEEGVAGVILAKGPGVMKGYYKDEAATAAAFPAGEGWFGTGDLGWRAPQGVEGSRMAGQVVLTGRCKDTIVLSSGKNVEPQPIEDALTSSALIKHAMVVGQDKRELGVLVFPPIGEEGAPPAEARRKLEQELEREVARLNAGRSSYHGHEKITHVKVVWAALSVEDGTLTRTMKPRRPAISSVYAAEVEQLIGQLRA